MRSWRGSPAKALAALLVLAKVVVPVAPAAAATQVQGAGSTWSQIAIDQWRADVAKFGIPINYQGVGSTQGRQRYYTGTVDFGVSEIPFQSCAPGVPNCTDEVQLAAARPYVYLPIVAGGTSLMYNLKYNGQMVTDLKLSGATITKIYTGVVTDWSDPAITADDGRHFAPQHITPVIRSDGSGTSAQFTAWMAGTQPALWTPFCVKYGIVPCGATSQYPSFPGAVGAQLSDNVANYVAESYNTGSLGYVEYGFATARNFPVVSVLNAAGYYVQPTAQDVAVALQRAQINADRTANLTGVYANTDPRAYPISSYSYMIAPTTPVAGMSTDKGNTLRQFIYYFVCTGQQKAEVLGYSPLPKNLVQAAFDAAQQIPGAGAPPNIDTSCANPTITGGFTTTNAPLPGQGAKAGAPPAAGPTTTRPSSTSARSSAGTATTGVVNAATATATTVTGVAAAASDPGSSDTAVTDGGGGSAAADQLAAAVSSSPQKVGGDNSVPIVPFLLLALVMLGVVFVPPALSVLRRRESAPES
jgi:phosphate transport system substrate-binding protein